MSVNRKSIEEYFNEDWLGVLSPKSLEVLVEQTCKAFKLNIGMDVPTQKEKISPQNLGKV